MGEGRGGAEGFSLPGCCETECRNNRAAQTDLADYRGLAVNKCKSRSRLEKQPNSSHMHIISQKFTCCWKVAERRSNIKSILMYSLIYLTDNLFFTLFSELFMCCFLHTLERLELNTCMLRVCKSVFNHGEIRQEILLPFQAMRDGICKHRPCIFYEELPPSHPLHAAVTQTDNAKHTATYDSSPRH